MFLFLHGIMGGMFKVKNLSVTVDGQEIIKGLTQDFTVPVGKFFVLFGPNGCGKSTLFIACMGFSKYEVSGDILLDGKKINGLKIDERVKSGLAYMYQHPPSLKGVKFEDVAKESVGDDLVWKEYSKDIDSLDARKFLKRDINVGLSGGEVKRSELLSLAMLENTKVFLFDEPDSGIDLDNLKKVGEYMGNLLKKKKAMGIIITHSGDILKYIDAVKGAVMYRGKIACVGKPMEILECIKEKGYSKCVNCKEVKK